MNDLLKYSFGMALGLCVGLGLYCVVGKSLCAFHKPVKHVAILTKDLSPHEDVIQGILRVLAKEDRMYLVPHVYRIDPREVQFLLSRLNTASAVETILAMHPDLILSVGGDLSVVAKEALEQRGPHIPLVFAAVADPVGRKLVKAAHATGCNVTGVNALDEVPASRLHLLLKVLPGVKRIALPYYLDSGPYVAQTAQALHALGRTCGIDIILVPVTDDQAALAAIKGVLGSVDVVMHLLACHSNRIADAVAKLCARAGVIFYSPNPMKAQRGEAPVAFGPHPSVLGKAAGEYARRILVDGVQASTLPVYSVEGCQRFVVNVDLLKNLGAPFDAEEVLLISCGRVALQYRKR